MKKETLFNPFYLAFPIILGLSVIAYLFWQEFDPSIFAVLKPDWRMWSGIILAVLFLLCQNFALTQRYKLFAGRKLSWKQAFRVNMLCEFTSAATPSAVGGSSLIAVYLHKEGLSGGEGTTIMIANLFLDELFLSLVCILSLLLFPADDLFMSHLPLDIGVQVIFITVVIVISLWTLVLYVALFHKAVWVARLLTGLFSLPFLRRWKPAVEKLGSDLATSSAEVCSRSRIFRLKGFLVTAWAWCSRFLVVNALLFAFSSGGDHFLAFIRQFVIWMILMVTPTPGGSGFGEYIFQVYYSDFFPVAGTALVVAFLWRVITYYTYLIGGACIIPHWLGGLRKKNAAPESEQKVG